MQQIISIINHHFTVLGLTLLSGNPHGTSVWQVGDSREQNRSFKTNLVKYKRELIILGRDSPVGKL